MESKWDKYQYMSPFEIKNELMHIAQVEVKKNKKKKILNAGRGNPNFLNVPVRLAFSHLNIFATKLAEEGTSFKDLGLRPDKKSIFKKFNQYCQENKKKEGVSFLKAAITFAIKNFKFDPDEFIFTIVDATLGDFYPVPSRIIPYFEEILRVYLNDVLGLKGNPKSKEFDLFATEGGAAAMVYLFQSLKINKIINPKDKIAILSPIFSPYLEMPHLKEYDLVEVLLEAKEEDNWQILEKEFKKLEDKKIKAVYLVNPANPASVALNDTVVKKLASFIKKKRPDLFVLTDTVYATFVEKFHSLVKEIPEQTICVYSFSKYFGVTGWRLGLVMMHKNNIIDKKIKKLSETQKKELDKRYRMVSTTPRDIPFIERLELDSRDIALAHTGGLSCPQQSIMTLFALYELLDTKKSYKKNIHLKLKQRITDFYTNLGSPVPSEKGNSFYYSLMDLKKIALYKYGKEFTKHLENKINPLEFLFKLAKDKCTILLPGKGFAGTKWSLRISLANLPDESYALIGKNISDVLEDFYKKWKK